ncbi:unnamed protein product, partial [Mesorhabditis spiculigera]
MQGRVEVLKGPLHYLRVAGSRSALSLSSKQAWQGYENERHYEPGEEPLKRTWHGLSYDFRRWARRFDEARKDAWQRRHPIAHMKRAVHDHELLPYRAEIVVIGGGLTGSSVAYWIKQWFRDEDFKVCVIENNDKFPQGSSLLSVGGISPQHSLAENIEMSLFTSEFLRHAGEHLRILDSERPDVNFYPCGYLHLACSEEDAETMRNNWKIQTEKGARIALLTRAQLEERFPAMVFDNVVLGSIALENEGVFDTWQLLSALREKNISLGVQYIKGEVEGFDFAPTHMLPEVHALEEGTAADELAKQTRRIMGLMVRPQMTDASARPIRCYMMVNCAGPWSGSITKLLGAGDGPGILSVAYPLEARKRTMFAIHAESAPPDLPMMVLPSGVWMRQDRPGHQFLVGKHMTAEEDAMLDHSNLEDIDYSLFYDTIWPELVKVVPVLADAKVKSAWARYESVNTFDGTPIIGEHPQHKNVYTIGGLGHRDAQHALAVGRAFAERMFEGAYVNINLRGLDLRRIVKKEPVLENMWP